MEWLNYHHLLYFWVVARRGSIASASEELLVSQPTISGQLKELEASLGERLFERRGRNLVLTDVGRTVFNYANEIFTLGREMLSTVKRGTGTLAPRLAVGVAEGLPKLVARALIEPVLRAPEAHHLVCREAPLEGLLAELAAHRLDVVLADAPAGAGVKVRSFSHLLGECAVAFFAAPALAQRLEGAFPACLDGAPMLLPLESALRRMIDTWLDGQRLRPRLVGEFQDSALLKTFGQAGMGVFPAPAVVEAEICRQYDVRPIGRVDALRERFYAISVERRLKHPAVVAISHAAQRELFTRPAGRARQGRTRRSRVK